VLETTRTVSNTSLYTQCPSEHHATTSSILAIFLTLLLHPSGSDLRINRLRLNIDP